jgi:predicted small metal-binding protein
MSAAERTDLVTNRCVCGWEFTGSVDEVVEATIDHGARIHNMTATRNDVLAAMGLASTPTAQDPAESVIARD